jgi:Domain of unknown function (DUF4365)
VLDENNRKVELSYAYLHAVAARAGLACSHANGHPDGSGMDARLEVTQKLDSQSLLTQFSLEFQFKATSRKLAVVNSKLSFPLEVDRYDSLRDTAVGLPRFTVLLSLPEEPERWLTVSADDLIANRCARWLCLQGAPETSSMPETTVRFPVWNVLTPEALREIARRVSLGGRFFHEQ